MKNIKFRFLICNLLQVEHVGTSEHLFEKKFLYIYPAIILEMTTIFFRKNVSEIDCFVINNKMSYLQNEQKIIYST